MPLPAIPALLTPRTRVCEVEPADLPDLMAVNGDAEVTRFLPYEAWRGADDAQAWLARMAGLAQSGAARQLVVHLRDGAAPAIGTVVLFRHDEGSARAEIGYVLGRAAWGRGYATEALTAVIGHAFGALALRRLEAEVDPANRASGALLRRLGFTCEGRLRERWLRRGQPHDVGLWGLLAHEWPAAHALPARTAPWPCPS